MVSDCLSVNCQERADYVRNIKSLPARLNPHYFRVINRVFVGVFMANQRDYDVQRQINQYRCVLVETTRQRNLE
jgi:hypothetical protein